MNKIAAIAAVVSLIAAPIPSFAHGAPNWKVVAWESNQDTPDGLRHGTLVNINSITRSYGDLVSYQEAHSFIDDKNLPMNRAGVPINPEELTAYLRVRDCKTNEYLHGSTFRSVDGSIEVKQLTTWDSVPAGSFRVVQNFVCSKR